MEQISEHRVLFCIGVSQNFMDSTQQVMGDVWVAFQAMIKGISDLQGVNVLGVLDDDRIQVGPSENAPWTAYIMADVPSYESVVAACDLFRSTPVGDGTYTLWKFMKVEARIGRGLEVPA
ncbi:MAG: hypothetical protein ACI9WC_001264 [Arenicella sp.]|jgi:hypothetical protein